MKHKDLKIEYTRGHGPGGQHKNKVETCVTITHIPTGIKVVCQDTRSRNRNLVIAKKNLQEKITKLENEKLQELKNKERKERIKTQQVVRTYNYNTGTVYDHRSKTKHELKRFMKGEIDI